MNNHFEARYKTGDTPWDHDTPDLNLTGMVEQGLIPQGKALDIGCGTGDNAIWLARHNFIATGCDISPTAIEKAEKKAVASNVDCSFIVIDFLNDKTPNSPFNFVFDRGCFHSFDSHEKRKQFAENVTSLLEEGGLWLSLTGNADDQVTRKEGPPQLTAKELVSTVEPYFEVISLTANYFGSDQTDPPKAWICLMRKRSEILISRN